MGVHAEALPGGAADGRRSMLVDRQLRVRQHLLFLRRHDVVLLVASLAAASSAAPTVAVVPNLGAARPSPVITTDAPVRRITAGNRIERITARGADVEIVLATDEFFDLRASNLVLSIGGARSVRSSHPDGNLRKVHFLVPRDEFDALSARDAISVRHGKGAGQVWEFGALDRAPLDR